MSDPRNTLYNLAIQKALRDQTRANGYPTEFTGNFRSDAMNAIGNAYNARTNGNLDYNRRPMLQDEYGNVVTTDDFDMTIGNDNMYTVKSTPIMEDGTVMEDPEGYLNSLDTSSLDNLLKSDYRNAVIDAYPGDYNAEYSIQLDNDLDRLKQAYERMRGTAPYNMTRYRR